MNIDIFVAVVLFGISNILGSTFLYFWIRYQKDRVNHPDNPIQFLSKSMVMSLLILWLAILGLSGVVASQAFSG